MASAEDQKEEESKISEGGAPLIDAVTQAESDHAAAVAASTKRVVPPLEAAALRLEKSLGGSVSTGGLSAVGSVGHSSGVHGSHGAMKVTTVAYSNPAKVVRRWLGTSSGATGTATLTDVAAAAARLFDPVSSTGIPNSVWTGRTALMTLKDIVVPEAAELGTIVMEVDNNDHHKEETSVTTDTKIIPIAEAVSLTIASAREVDSWLTSLAVRLLWKAGHTSLAYEVAQSGIERTMSHIAESAHRSTSVSIALSASSLFPLLARLYRWREIVAESLPNASLVAMRRTDMATAYNLATIRRDTDSQATLLNCMLRDLLLHKQVEQANKLLANTTFPETASNNQLCRYLYHSGRIQALRLEYTLAFSNLSQCLRKSPTNTGLGFRIAAQRLLVVVQLLMGEIPERHVFFTDGMTTELHPYLSITQAVRRGDLAVYNRVVTEFAARFQADTTYTLISRLAHQVVKAGLRKLHVSYSRLSLTDVAMKLGLPNAASAELVVAKAVRDGVLDATIHHAEGYVLSHDLVDVYSTREPAEAFHRRIAYCLTAHNDAVRGMRYPPDEYKKQLEKSRGNRRKRSDDKTDEEKAQELEDEFDEDY